MFFSESGTLRGRLTTDQRVPIARGFERLGGSLYLLLVVIAVSVGCGRHADEPPGRLAVAPGAAALGELLLERFASGPPAAFDSIYPLPRGRGMVAFAADRDLPRRPGFARVVWADGDRAVLALAGHIEFGNSGDETIYSEGFSGLYEALRDDTGGWRLGGRIPPDSVGWMNEQTLNAALTPGQGLVVTAELDIAVNGPYGFVARLNHAAQVRHVRLGGRPVEHEFGGGLLWVRIPQVDQAELVLEYELDVARDSAAGPNSGRFEPAYGHVRNQYFWHPRGDRPSRFALTVRAPAAFHVASDLPQRDSLAGALRIVRSRSELPVPALSLLYDREWVPEFREAGSLQLALFATADFRPGPDSLTAAFSRVHRLLSERFGEPHGGYTAVIQGRAQQGAGWLYLSNHAIVTAAQGGAMIQATPVPRAYFGHEIAHAWTHPTGPAANFLSEGWATFVESILLADAFGPQVEQAFWEHQRNRYHVGGFEGKSILDDPLNSGIAYHKGAWILRMLRDFVGADSFRAGLREYARIEPGQPAGTEAFVASLATVSGMPVDSFLRPWLQGSTIPDITAHVDGNRLIVMQHGPVFRLPLDVELVTHSGRIRRTVAVAQQQDTFALGDTGPVADVLVDPDHRLLLHRRRGEMVRFELSASDARTVALSGDFTARPIPAVVEDAVWSVVVPLSSGHYVWNWTVDGLPLEAGVRTVLPLQDLSASYPR